MPRQLGLESTPEEYVLAMVDVFREVWRVLRDDGTLWLNMGDGYCSGISSPRTREDMETGTERALPRNWFSDANKIDRNGKPPGWKEKDLIATSWMLALALRADGWYLRSDIIWYKKNPMPETVKDRPTKAHEYIFLLSKSRKYYFSEAHFATFPEELIKPCILAGCPQGGTVFDPFVGSGTTILVAESLQCHGIGLELNPEYIEIAKRRIAQQTMEFV